MKALISYRKDPKNDILFISPRQYPKRHRSAYVMAVFFFIVVASGYIILKSSAFFAVPELNVAEPADGVSINNALVKFAGSTEPRTRLTVNNYEVFSDENGNFEFSLPFIKGFHIVDIRVENRLGNEARVVRRIVVK